MSEREAGQPADVVLRRVAQRLEEAWNAHDLERVADVFAEDAVLVDPGAPEAELRGRAAIRSYFGGWLRAFPDVRMRQEVLFRPLEGDEFASRWRISGTMRNALDPPGFAATNRRVETEGVAVIELRDGLVTRCRQFYDTTEVARQLGAAPPRGSRFERLGVSAQRVVVGIRRRARR
jgi:steroid delta-isomerase-like uncharacterized protein